MTDRVLGTVVFSRTEALSRLFESASSMDRVYVADNGRIQEREDLYNQNYPFELIVIDVPFDAGISASRNRVLNELTSDLVLFLDCDMIVPPNVEVLFQLITSDQSLGGVCGTIVEPQENSLYQPAKDFYEENGDLVRTSPREKNIRMVDGYPLINFDMVPQAGVFRRECLQDCQWDPEYTSHKEHLDFFVNHWKNTDWSFAITPSVTVGHYPGGPESYQKKRHDEEKKSNQTEYFLEKWGYDDERMGDRYYYSTDGCSEGYISRSLTILQEEGMTRFLQKAYSELRSLTG